MKPRSPPLQSTRLLDQVRERVRYLHYSLSTEKNYLYWIRFFIRQQAVNGQMRHPSIMGTAEVESALVDHPAVLEAAVVGRADDEGLIKPAAYVVLNPGYRPHAAMGDALKQHVRAPLAHYKYPRWIEFLAELPKTATGKIQRFTLRCG